MEGIFREEEIKFTESQGQFRCVGPLIKENFLGRRGNMGEISLIMMALKGEGGKISPF